MKNARSIVYVVAVAGVLVLSQAATAVQIEVSITNTAPAGGVYLTPVWVGFHDGNFDSYDSGAAASGELERLAEDGNTAPLSASFLSGTRVDGTMPGPLPPRSTATAKFTVSDPTSDHQYFSYASMVLLSNDYFIANDNPLAVDISSLTTLGATPIVITVLGNQVNDAGTEVNDFDTSAGGGVITGLGAGQGMNANVGADQGGVVTLVTDPYLGFLNTPGDFATNFPNLVGFNSGGIATITLTVIPEPASALLLGTAAAFMFTRRRRQAG